MPDLIPDLWRSREDAFRLYSFYLLQLQSSDKHNRVISACRRIRQYAARGPGREQGLFTFDFEIDSLCALKDFKIALRQLRLWEEIAYGERFDLATHEWSVADAGLIESGYSPLLYFLGRYRHGCELLEKNLDLWCAGKKVHSYHLLHRIYNGDDEPDDRCRVTLSHFYNRLGKTLNEWQHWNAFVNAFHPRLYQLSKINRNDLLANPAQLADFYNNLMDIRDERTISGVGGSQSDLIESDAKVRKGQENTLQKVNEFQETFKPTQDRINQKLMELFPELERLPN